MRSILVSMGAVFIAAGCGGSQEPAAAPPTTESPSADESPATPPSEEAERPKLSAEQCEASGGSVVGDIGDGAVHRPDYRCANGAAPTGSILAPEGGPIGVEGSVCCPK